MSIKKLNAYLSQIQSLKEGFSSDESTKALDSFFSELNLYAEKTFGHNVLKEHKSSTLSKIDEFKGIVESILTTRCIFYYNFFQIIGAFSFFKLFSKPEISDCYIEVVSPLIIKVIESCFKHTDSQNVILSVIGQPQNVKPIIFQKLFQHMFKIDTISFLRWKRDFEVFLESQHQGCLVELKESFHISITDFDFSISMFSVLHFISVFVQLWKYPFQTLSIPITLVREKWLILRGHHDMINRALEFFQESAVHSENPYFLPVHQLFLLDMEISNPEIWKNAFFAQKQKNGEYKLRFHVYFAICYYHSIFGFNKQQLMNMMTPNSAKTYGDEITHFMKNSKFFFDRPWMYACQYTKIPEIDYGKDPLATQFHIDIKEDLCTPYSQEILIASLIGNPLLISVFCLVCHYFWRYIPPNVTTKPLSLLSSIFLVPLLKSVAIPNNQTSPIILLTLKTLFNDFTMVTKATNDVFNDWSRVFIPYLFSGINEMTEIAFQCLCDAIRHNHPTKEITAPLFLYFVKFAIDNPQVIPSIKNGILIMNAFESIFTKNSLIIPNVSFLKDLISTSPAFFQQDITRPYLSIISFDPFSLIIEFIMKSDSSFFEELYSLLLHCYIELAVSGINPSVIEKYLIEQAPKLNEDGINSLFALEPFAFYMKCFMPNLIRSLLSNKSIHTLTACVELMISTSKECNYDSLIPILKSIFKDKMYINIKRLFLTQFNRYPYHNGIEFRESKTELFSVMPQELAVFNDISLIGAVSKDSKHRVSVFGQHGTTSYDIIPVIPPPYNIISNQNDLNPPIFNQGASWPEIQVIQPTHYFQSPKEIIVDNTKVESKKTFEKPINVMDSLSQIGYYMPLSHNNYKSYEHDQINISQVKKIAEKNIRLGHKIGLLYVGKEQRNQIEVLKNEIKDISPDFIQFVKLIGWHIDLATHLLSSGGLDTLNFTSGKTSVYYADSKEEAMFHVGPLIPTSSKDQQCVYKKRHIGNDNIHIVWSEDNEEYDTRMIVSQFNHAHVVVYPFNNQTCGIQVVSKPNVKWFPLLKGKTTVSVDVAASLVRFTAIQADTAARQHTSSVIRNLNDLQKISNQKVEPEQLHSEN